VEKVLNHAESRSVGELIVKILVNETTICLDQRKTFYKSILNKLSSSSEIYVLSLRVRS
jgi:archaellum biogenesis protein FlaJ (TadC family)